MAMLKPKIKVKKETSLTKTSPEKQHDRVMENRKSELQMERQIDERARKGMR